MTMIVKVAVAVVISVALFLAGVAPDAWHALLLGFVIAHTK
jgi:hypothetical protein